jgi:hypothetical protein
MNEKEAKKIMSGHSLSPETKNTIVRWMMDHKYYQSWSYLEVTFDEVVYDIMFNSNKLKKELEDLKKKYGITEVK